MEAGAVEAQGEALAAVFRMGGLGGLPGFGGGSGGSGGGGGGGFAGGGGSSGGGGASAGWTGGGGGSPGGLDTGMSSDASPSAGAGPAGDPNIPAGLLQTATQVALQSGPGGVDKFMRDNGYPRNGAWCGQFAASVVKSQGLTPPQNPGIASNWANWGEAVTGAPQPGDVAIRKGAGGAVNVGRTGSHVTFVSGHDPVTGRVSTIGGNQGASRAERNRGVTGESRDRADRYVYRRAPGGGMVSPGSPPGMGGSDVASYATPSGAGGSGAENLQRKLGISPQQYDTYRETLAGIESGGKYNIRGGAGGHYTGRYQFGKAEIRETAQRLGETPPSREQYQSDPAMQERYLPKYMEGHHESLMKSSARYRNAAPADKLAILGYSHNQGAGGAAKWLRTGQEGRDAFGTSGAKYTRELTRALKGVPGREEVASTRPGFAGPRHGQGDDSQGRGLGQAHRRCQCTGRNRGQG